MIYYILKEYFSKTEFICGDATDLFNLLKEKVKFEIWNGPRVVACVGNTFGIMPNQIKEKIIDQVIIIFFIIVINF